MFLEINPVQLSAKKTDSGGAKTEMSDLKRYIAEMRHHTLVALRADTVDRFDKHEFKGRRRARMVLARLIPRRAHLSFDFAPAGVGVRRLCGAGI